MFWQRLMAQRASVRFGHAIFMAFSLEQLQTTQTSMCPIAAFPFVVPRRRIRFDRADGAPAAAPSHSNMIVYVHDQIDRTELFCEVFEDLGAVIDPRPA
jgi:hypothetical protein